VTSIINLGEAYYRLVRVDRRDEAESLWRMAIRRTLAERQLREVARRLQTALVERAVADRTGAARRAPRPRRPSSGSQWFLHLAGWRARLGSCPTRCARTDRARVPRARRLCTPSVGPAWLATRSPWPSMQGGTASCSWIPAIIASGNRP